MMPAYKPPPNFPMPWAVEWGEDRDHGLWMTLDIQGVEQVFRWMSSGTFWMGSPDGSGKEKAEAGRFNDEDRHEVSLDGFWLADTPVTQQLYTSVMKQQPSEFEGEQKPVDSVSWEDAQDFVQKLSEALPELALRLPYEAEWEYACRAGTQTPFSFGQNITTDQANYNGNHPYDEGGKGEYRNQTIEVKGQMPANQWGLYQMHGNVWEWCQDYWQENLGHEPVSNPLGPDSGDSRVLRGGSWFDGGQLLRSAFRYHYHPSLRIHDLGFRLALGPELQQAKPGPDKTT